jgi:predicted DNA-binding protein (UPF0251 family)
MHPLGGRRVGVRVGMEPGRPLLRASQEEALVGVEQWAEIRRMYFVAGLSIKEIARRMGRDRNTVRRALRSSGPPVYRRAPRPS